jgi:hypothetical protein
MVSSLETNGFLSYLLHKVRNDGIQKLDTPATRITRVEYADTNLVD